MTTTAPSKPKAAKNKSALENLLALEEVRETAKEEASRIGSEYHSKFQQFRGLHDRRHQLAHREPRLVDHQGQPAEPGNAIAEIDKEVAALGDLNDLGAQVEHARKVAAKAEEDVTEYAARSFYAIVDELKPEASKLRDELQAWNDTPASRSSSATSPSPVASKGSSGETDSFSACAPRPSMSRRTSSGRSRAAPFPSRRSSADD